MKKFIALAAILLSAGCTSNNSGTLLSQVQIITYTVGGSPSGSSFFVVNFHSDSVDDLFLNVLADFDGDGAYADYDNQTEWIVVNMKPVTDNSYVNRFAFESNDSSINDLSTVNMVVSLTSTPITDIASITGANLAASVSSVSAETLLALDVPGANEELKRGSGDFDSMREADTPDLSGGQMDCFPISAANNIISLAQEHDKADGLPSPSEMINELKTDMKWNNGVTKANFTIGKQAFVDRYKLPIQTRRIDNPTMDDLRDALDSGAAIEISTTMIRSSSGKADTGHVLTGVSAAREGDMAQIGVHDPATGEGCDLYEIAKGNYIIIKYPLWDGVTFVDSIFVQTWNATLQTAAAYSLTTEDTQLLTGCPAPFAGGYKYAPVLVISDVNYPLFQFEFDGECWYLNGVAVSIGSTETTTMTDSTPVCSDFNTDAMPVDETMATSFFSEYYSYNS